MKQYLKVGGRFGLCIALASAVNGLCPTTNAVAATELNANGETLATPENSAQEVNLKVGDQAPDFDIESLDGKRIKLSERFGKDGRPVILLFSRANW